MTKKYKVMHKRTDCFDSIELEDNDIPLSAAYQFNEIWLVTFLRPLNSGKETKMPKLTNPCEICPKPESYREYEEEPCFVWYMWEKLNSKKVAQNSIIGMMK